MRGVEGVDEETADRIVDEDKREKQANGHDEPPNVGIQGGPYVVDCDGCIAHKQLVKGPLPGTESFVVVPLCNFNCWVNEEILMDDGAETVRHFLLNGRLAGSSFNLPVARIPASRFGSMTWVAESWGLRAVVRAGQATRDRLREAIQILSPNPKLRRIFTHTGWRKIDDAWIYLSSTTAGGDFEVDLGADLSRYKLASIPDDPVDAMRESLKLLELAPYRVTAPLWAATFRAPLVSAFPQDLSIWLEGQTGPLKSTMAALFLSHFGDFRRETLPAAWESTANILEKRAFLLKDSLFVIDEYVPNALNRRDMETKASRIIRAQGNLSGRGRLKSDLTERPTYTPRGIIVSTGEQHPPGQSLMARCVIIEIKRDEVQIDRLTQAQAQAGRLSHAMVGYLRWLAPQMDDLPDKLRETFKVARARATVADEHLRIPEAAAHLWIGLTVGLSYAVEVGAIDKAERERIQRDAWNAFLEIGRAQAMLVDEEKPIKRFFEVLNTLFTQGRAVLAGKDERIESKPGVDFIGWVDTNFWYLIPEASYLAVVRFCRDTSEPFPIRRERLQRDLEKDGISECDKGRLTRQVKIAGYPRRVLKIDIKKVEALLGESLESL